ncbi:MAG: ATP-binding cassette domain-containing protein, partial [Gemmataceae bacterium]
MSGLAEQVPTTAHAADGTVVSATHPTPDTRHPLLLFEYASKWYGQVLALNQVTLTLTGGITGLVGGNGAGKSTLIKLAAGLIAPTIGRVTVGGLDASDWHARRLV